MLIGTKDLTDHSIRESLLAMMKRAFSAAPLHALLMFYVVYSTPELRASNFAWIIFGLTCTLSSLRAIQHYFFSHLLDQPQTVSWWRVLFASHMIPLGLCWGLLCGLSLHHVGLKTSTIALFALISAVSAGAIVTFSIDLLLHSLFQVALLSPIVVSAFALNDESSHSLAIGVIFFMAFEMNAGRGMFRFQRDLLKNAEVVTKQKESLNKTHASLSEAYATMGAMLESIEEAFLTFDSDGICSGQCSEKSKSILGFDPSGRHLAEILGIEPENRDDLAFWYEYTFAGKTHFDIMAETAPKSMKAWKGNRTLKVAFHAVKNNDGSTRSIIMTATDVTKELAAEVRANEARDRAELILRVHENPTGFRSLIETYVKLLDKMRNWSGGDLVTLRREMHNMKGGMMAFGARRTSARIYEGELLIKKLSPETATSYIRSLGDQLNNFYIQWRALESKLISQINLFDEEVVKISKKTLRGIEKRVSRDATSRQIAGEIMQSIFAYELGDQLEDYRFHVEETALKLNKKVILRINRATEPVFIEKSVYEALRTLVHIFNNSIDHGIEKPEDRIKAGKREYGSIQIFYARQLDGRTQIIIEDDGGGIKLAKLRRPEDEAQRVSDFEIVSRIFNDGQSTADQVTAVSGQGIGMGAVKSAIEAVQGEIRVLRTSPSGAAFEITLPGLPIRSQSAA